MKRHAISPAMKAAAALTRSIFLLPVLLAGCLGGPAGGALSLRLEADDPVAVLQRINQAGAQCWMRSSDATFRNLHLMPELDTRAGKPRLLLLENGKAQGLPVLVIEADGSPVTITTYGPLAGTAAASRVNADITRWSKGPLACRDRQ